jgi:hypothetical protein
VHTTLDEPVVRRLERGARLLFGRRQELSSVPPEEPLGQQARVERGLGVGDSGAPELLTAGRNPIVNGRQETAVASFSFSDW